MSVYVNLTGELALAVGLKAPDARWTATCQALQTAIQRFVNSKCGTIDSSSSSSGSKSKKHANGSTLTSTAAGGTAAVNLKGLVAPLPNDEVSVVYVSTYQCMPYEVCDCCVAWCNQLLQRCRARVITFMSQMLV
jgi:hypothetical protein